MNGQELIDFIKENRLENVEVVINAHFNTSKFMELRDLKINRCYTRVKPSKTIGDRSYMGDKLKIKSITNGMIYAERLGYFAHTPDWNQLALPIDEWGEGWEEWKGE